jgi:hypothetical protein
MQNEKIKYLYWVGIIIFFVSVFLIYLLRGFNPKIEFQFIVSLWSEFLKIIQNPFYLGINSFLRFVFYILGIFSIGIIPFIFKNSLPIWKIIILSLTPFVFSIFLLHFSFVSLLFYLGVLGPLLLFFVYYFVSVLFLVKEKPSPPNKSKTLLELIDSWLESWQAIEVTKRVQSMDQNYISLTEKNEFRYREMAEKIKNALIQFRDSLNQNIMLVKEQIQQVSIEHNEVVSLKNELEKYKKGFKLTENENLFKKLILLKASLEKQLGDSKGLISQAFDNFLFNLNIVTTKFSKGDPYDPALMIVIDYVLTQDFSLDMKISEVLSQGYLVQEGLVNRLVHESYVKVFKFIKEDK